MESMENFFGCTNIRIIKIRIAIVFLCISQQAILAQDKTLEAGATPRVFIEITTKENRMTDFSAIGLGDSLLFSYVEQSGESMVRMKSLTLNGQTKDLFLQDNLLASSRWGTKIYYYMLTGSRKELMLSAKVEEIGVKSATNVKGSIPLPGKLVGTFTRKNLNIVLYHEKLEEISVLEIKEMELVRTRKFKLPIGLAQFVSDQEPIAFMQDESVMNSFNGNARVKLYRYDDNYFITLDVPASGGRYSGGVRTELLLLGENSEKITIPEESNRNFRSYYFDGMLFRLVIAGVKYAQLSIYDVSKQKQLASMRIEKGTEEFKIYTRDGSKNTLTHDETFKEILMVYNPSVVVYKDSEKYLIQCGHYLSEKRAGGFGGPNVLAATVAMAVETAVRQMREETGTSRYFYMTFDGESKSIAVNHEGTSLLRESIDKYEIEKFNEETGAKIGFKGYLDHKEGVIGVYYDRKTKTVRFVLFKSS